MQLHSFAQRQASRELCSAQWKEERRHRQRCSQAATGSARFVSTARAWNELVCELATADTAVVCTMDADRSNSSLPSSLTLDRAILHAAPRLTVPLCLTTLSLRCPISLLSKSAASAWSKLSARPRETSRTQHLPQRCRQRRRRQRTRTTRRNQSGHSAHRCLVCPIAASAPCSLRFCAVFVFSPPHQDDWKKYKAGRDDDDEGDPNRILNKQVRELAHNTQRTHTRSPVRHCVSPLCRALVSAVLCSA